MNEARFPLLELSLYPAVRTARKAERVIGEVQRLLPLPLHLLSIAPHESPTPLFRVDAEVTIDSSGAYPTFAYILEFLRPVHEMWEIVIPSPSLCHTRWHLWGGTKRTNVIGLAHAYFEAYSEVFSPNEGAV